MNNNSHRPQAMVPEDDLINVKDLINQVIRIWPYILLSLFVTITIAFLVIRYTVPVYQVSSKFFVKEKETTFGIFENAGLDGNEMGLSNQMIILKSRPIAEATLDQLDFDVEYYTQGVFVRSEIYRNTPIAVEVDWQQPQPCNGDILIKWENRHGFTITFLSDEYTQVFPGDEGRQKLDKPVSPTQRFDFGRFVDLPYARFKVGLTGPSESGEAIIRIRDRTSLVNHYTGRSLQITPMDKQSTILQLTLNTQIPQKGKDYLDRLQQVYLEKELEEKNEMATNTIDFIDAQLVVLSDSLMYIENRLGNFRSNHSIYNLSSEGSMVFEQMTEMERELAQQRFRRSYYQQLREYLVREDYNEIVVPSGLGIEDPILNSLIMNLLELRAERSRHLAKLTANSPPVREVNRKISDLNASIREVLANVDQNAQLGINDLESRINLMEREFNRLPQTEQNLLRIQREFSLNEGLYTYLLQKRAESAITRASNTPSNKIIEAALINPQPISPKRQLTYLIAVVLGLAIPIGVSFLRGYFNTKIKDVAELDKKSNIPLLAKILYSEEKDNLVVMNHPRSGVTEAFRSLRANINFILPKDRVAVIMVTSSISGEGKTFCSMNLASVYALSGKRTILVGCDLRKPKIFEDFGLSNQTGLSSYLSGQVEDLGAIIQPTAYADLDVIASGPIPPNPAELLITDRFHQMMAMLREQYEVVILDTPPVGLVSESLELIQEADLTLFIVRYNYSQKHFIEHINTLKKQEILKKAYLVFNGMDKAAGQYGGYGYGYGYYEEDQRKRKPWEKLLSKN